MFTPIGIGYSMNLLYGGYMRYWCMDKREQNKNIQSNYVWIIDDYIKNEKLFYLAKTFYTNGGQ